jgi:predicted lipoprotein with Yx(FWY)xxD motif
VTKLKQEVIMRHRKIMIAVITVAAAAGVSGIAAAATSGSAMTAASNSNSSLSQATIHTQDAMVGGKEETILVDSQGLPLYYYNADTATKSFVSGELASLWPPLDSSSPSITGAPGKVSVTNDANGAQVAYNGHFLYTFADDSAGHVSGQGVQGFFVATPGLATIGTSSSVPTPVPTSSSGTSYGY